MTMVARKAGRRAGVVAAAVLTAVSAATAGGAAAATAGAVGAGAAAGSAAASHGVGDTGGSDGVSYADLRTAARFSPPMAFVPSLALTYDTKLVPAGARIEIEQLSGGGQGTTVVLHVSGVRAGHAFGAHVHTNPCGADPAAAGEPYRNLVDPSRSPTAPAYVDAQNEVWLNFTADAQGMGEARAHHTWGFRSGQAGSVVILDRPGAGGVPVACFTVPFGAVSKG